MTPEELEYLDVVEKAVPKGRWFADTFDKQDNPHTVVLTETRNYYDEKCRALVDDLNHVQFVCMLRNHARELIAAYKERDELRRYANMLAEGYFRLDAEHGGKGCPNCHALGHFPDCALAKALGN